MSPIRANTKPDQTIAPKTALARRPTHPTDHDIAAAVCFGDSRTRADLLMTQPGEHAIETDGNFQWKLAMGNWNAILRFYSSSGPPPPAGRRKKRQHA
jgi:hypothetical protein